LKHSRQCSPTAENKTVRFATNMHNGKEWCMARTFNKVPPSRHGDVWWSEDEMYERQCDDQDTASCVETRFEAILNRAYESTSVRGNQKSKSGEGSHNSPTSRFKTYVDLDFKSLEEISDARGLESEVCADVQKHVNMHRHAVLAAQRILQEKGLDLRQDKSVEFIAMTSSKYSKPSRLISKKMAQFDNDVSKYSFKALHTTT